VPAPHQPAEPPQRRLLLRSTVDRLVEPLIVAWAARADDRAADLEQRIATMADAHAGALAATAGLERRVADAETRLHALEAGLINERALRAAEVASIGAGLADQSALAQRLATLEDAVGRQRR